MVRFIFLCMAVVAIAVAAIPGMSMINGIVKEHAKSMDVASRYEKETASEVAMEQDAADADELNKLETAAGAEDKDFGDEEIPGGFNNIEPAAFGEPSETE
jgi:hypothetical protein